MDTPAEPGTERRVVWSAGTEPTLRRPPRQPDRRASLVLGAAAAVGVLVGIGITWAEISPFGSPPDPPLWIAPGSPDQVTEVRPSSAPTPSPATSERARGRMSELTVVPLSRPTTADRSARPAPSPSRSARAVDRDSVDRDTAARGGRARAPRRSPAPKASASARHPDRSGPSKKKSESDHGDSSAARSNSGPGSDSSGRSGSKDSSGPGS